MPPSFLVKIAADTLAAVEKGSYVDLAGETHEIPDLAQSTSATEFHPPDSPLSGWATSLPAPGAISHQTELVLRKNSTLEGVQYCIPLGRKIGVLNFASATRPGGGFIGGARAQEETIARSSNLYSSLMTPEGQKFYRLHKTGEKSKYYTHAMIYTRDVQIFRNDGGDWVKPSKVDMLTSAAVNAGVVRRRAPGESTKAKGGGDGKKVISAYFNTTSESKPGGTDVERAIEGVMKQRMGRLLFLFEKEGAQDLVLGSFGTGVFQNNVAMVAKLWAELLAAPDSRFKNSFQRVVFAIIDQKTCDIFKNTFNSLQVPFIEGSATEASPLEE